MRCPECDTENADSARQCAGCGKELRRRPRRRSSSNEGETSGQLPEARDPFARAAYRLALYGMIPFVGLVLGPLALGVGAVAWLRVRKTPTPEDIGHALTAMGLGALILLTNWVGLAFIVYGLTSS